MRACINLACYKKICDPHVNILLVTWSPRLPFKLGDPDSILGPTSTQGLKIIEKKVLPYIDISKCMVRLSRLLG
jgi:hypothetical protein